MCGSMADIQSATAEIRRGKKRKKKKELEMCKFRMQSEMCCYSLLYIYRGMQETDFL